MNVNQALHGVFEAQKDLMRTVVSLNSRYQELATVLNDQNRTYQGDPAQAFGHLTYAQHGEDLILINYFHLLRIDKPTWLDIGAHHPLNLSNTALLYAAGGKGVNIEANPELMPDFQRFRPRDTNVNCGIAPSVNAAGQMTFYLVGHGSGLSTFSRKRAEECTKQWPGMTITGEITVNVININEAVTKYCGSVWPDLLSIDAETLDYDILATADFSRSRPKFICVERAERAEREKWSYQDAGYVLGCKTIGNDIFVDRTLREIVQD